MNNSDDKNKLIMLYASIAISVFCVVLPFFTWFEIPAVNSLGGMFGQSEVANFSLFGYFDSINLGFINIFAFIVIIINLIYAILTLMKKSISKGLGMLSSIFSLILGGLFSLLSSISKGLTGDLYEITFCVYIFILISIINIVLIKKFKKN